MIDGTNSIYFYHPQMWRHVKDIAKSNPDLASTTVEKITEFVPTSKTDDILFWMTRLMNGGSPVDRTGKLNKFNVTYSPIPTVDSSFNKTFGQICLETAENFWKTNSKINILWSGGIDSTSAALALLETKPENSVLSIICTEGSIAEYPAFYNTHTDLCRVLTGEQLLSLDILFSTELVITGDVGDQLFGANLGREAVNGTHFANMNNSWTSIFEFDDPFKTAQFDTTQNPSLVTPWTPAQLDNFVNIIEEHATACPFPVKTLFDMNWWLNFSTKMNFVTARIPVLILEQCDQDVTKIDLNSRQAFYLNDDFQRWALSDRDLKVPTSLSTFKQPAKDFIFSLNGDADYAANKRKEPSTPKMLANGWFSKWKMDNNANYAILGNGQVFNSRNHMSTEVLDNLFSDQS